MWVAAFLAGIALCGPMTRPRRRINNRVQNNRRLHVSLGWALLIRYVVILLRPVGLRSQWAGSNVDKMRTAFGWLTPQVNAQLEKTTPAIQ